MPPKKNKRVTEKNTSKDEKEFECSICLEIPEKAMITTNCGHLYCESCIDTLLKNSGEKKSALCAFCKEPFTRSTVHHCLRTQRQINAMPIGCPSNDCTWRKARSELAKHLERCPEGEVCCPHAEDGCEAVMKRKDVQAHLEENEVLHLKLQVATLKTELKSVRTQLRGERRNVILPWAEGVTTYSELFVMWDRDWRLSSEDGSLFITSDGETPCTLTIIPFADSDEEPLELHFDDAFYFEGIPWVSWEVDFDKYAKNGECFVEVYLPLPPACPPMENESAPAPARSVRR